MPFNRRSLIACRTILAAVALLLPIFAIPHAAHAAEKNVTPRDLNEAQDWIRKFEGEAGGKDITFDMNMGIFSYNSRGGGKYSFALGNLAQTQITTTSQTRTCRVSLTNFDGSSSWWQTARQENCPRFQAAIWMIAKQMQQNINAKNDEQLALFKVKANAWRALAVKPKMPDDAYPHKVLAEQAYKDKDLVRAMQEYQQALTVFSTWPEGHFNLALIAAELKQFRVAEIHMKAYLMLMPDAPDAQTAKDNIIIWTDRMTHLETTPPAN